MPLYFTAVVAFHLHSVNEVFVGMLLPNWAKPKKHLHICNDSSIQQTQADQLNESNCCLAFRVSSKRLCVEEHWK